MEKLQLQLVTPERTVITEKASSITIPTTEGFITILPGHAPLVATLISGEMIVKNDAGEHPLHVGGGFVHIKPGNQITVLSDAAEHVDEIDLARAEQAKLDAEQALKQQSMSDEEYALTAALLQRNLSRIAIVRKHSHRRTRITSEGVFHSGE